jgi:diaminopimelate epimerase
MVASDSVFDAPPVKRIHYYKMTGSGNDFVVLDGRRTAADAWPPDLVKAICDRSSGVGADGLVILSPSSPSAVRMTYWNADGSPAAMCGNAALCCGTLALELGMMPPGEFDLLTDAGMVRVRSQETSELAEISVPDFEAPASFSAISLGPGEQWIMRLTVGVPHLVVRVQELESVDVAIRGSALRFDPGLGPEGANVNFVSRSGDDRDSWVIRTYERGVEGETLACGTGTVAAAAALVAHDETCFPVRFRSRGGQPLMVQGKLADGQVTQAWLGGQGRLLFKGVWESGDPRGGTWR